MRQGKPVKVLGAILVFAGVALAVMMVRSPAVKAHDDRDEESLIRIGFEIAPVHLNLEGKNRDLVGLGSFIVNAQGDCNGCHTAGGPPNFNYAAGGNPYFLNQGPTKTDPTTYLAGGTDFFSAVPPIPGYPPPEYGSYVGPDIISRNLTPDKNGRPEGGHTLSEFKKILRTGIDFDHIHPTCTAALPTPTPANCIPPPVNGDVLQVMPWPVFAQMTDHQIEAIYEYLSAIPCIDNNFSPAPAGAPDELRNDCGDPKPGSQNAPAFARRSSKP